MTIWVLVPLLASALWTPPIASADIQAQFRPAAAYGSGHRGIDFAAEPGAEITAVARATVVLAKPVAGKPVIVLLVEAADGGHLRVSYEPVIPDVEVGQVVVAGQSIGTLASSGGHCGRAPHCLHLGVKQEGRYLNPAAFLSTGRVVLKPVA